MNDKLNDKDLDNIFRNSLESAEVTPSENFWNGAEEHILDNSIKASVESSELEPSDNFWTKAYDSILQRESMASQASLANWKRAAIGLACLLIGFIGYNIYLTNRVNDLGKQVADIQTNMITQTGVTAQHNTGNATVAMNSAVKNEIAAQQNSANADNVVNTPDASNTVTAPVNVNTAKVPHNSVASNMVASSVTRHAKASRWIANNTAANTPGANRTAKVVAYNVRKNTYQSSKTFEFDAAEQIREHNMIAMLADPTPPGLPVEKTIIQRPTSKLAELVYDNSNNFSQADSAYKPGMGDNAPYFRKIKKHKASISGFIAPCLIMGGNFHTIESERAAYALGINMGYDISSAFTLMAGVNFQSYSYSMKNAVINSIAQDNGVEYQVITSSGAVNAGLTPQPTDKISAYVDGTRSYLDIPLQLKYNLYNKKMAKIRLYAVAGGSMNILMNTNANITFVSPSGNENITMNGISGTNTLGFAYLLGVGGEYRMGNGINLSLEPLWTGSITPVNSASPIKAYPNFLSLQMGVTYHF